MQKGKGDTKTTAETINGAGKKWWQTGEETKGISRVQ